VNPKEPFEIPGGSLVSDLGVSEYIQYKQELDEQRRVLKADFTFAKRKQNDTRHRLIDRYDKLWKIISQRRERDLDRIRKFKGNSDALDNARAEEIAYKEMLLNQIAADETSLEEVEKECEQKQNYLATFLAENGRILNVVEKAEALDTQGRRKAQREKAHQEIIAALQGTVTIDISSHANMRDAKDMESSVTDLCEELQRLRDNEEFTDDLVDRLKNKVESIDLIEESQVQMIDSQLIKQRKLGQKVRDLQSQVERNNVDLQNITDKVKSEISDQLYKLIGPNKQMCLLAAISLIFFFVVGVFVYYILISPDGE